MLVLLIRQAETGRAHPRYCASPSLKHQQAATTTILSSTHQQLAALCSEQTGRPDWIIPDQARPDQTRSDQTASSGRRASSKRVRVFVDKAAFQALHAHAHRRQVRCTTRQHCTVTERGTRTFRRRVSLLSAPGTIPVLPLYSSSTAQHSTAQYTHPYIHTYLHTYTCTCACTRTCTRTHTYTQVYVHPHPIPNPYPHPGIRAPAPGQGTRPISFHPT